MIAFVSYYNFHSFCKILDFYRIAFVLYNIFRILAQFRILAEFLILIRISFVLYYTFPILAHFEFSLGIPMYFTMNFQNVGQISNFLRLPGTGAGNLRANLVK